MDNELLRFLSQLFDVKLKRIHDDIKDIKNNQANIENKLDSLIEDVEDLTVLRSESHSQLEAIITSDLKGISKFKTVK